MHSMSPPQGGFRRLAQPKIAHLSLLHQLAHCAHSLLNGRFMIDAMLKIQVEVIHLQPPQSVFARLADMGGTASNRQ
jgi:hypothetical protein